MKIKYFVALIGIFFVITGRSEVIPELAGYKQVTITKVEPDGVRIMYKDGVAKIPYKLLPEEMQARYKFNPDAASVYQEKKRSQQVEQDMTDEALAILKKNNAAISGTVLQVIKGGVLLKNIVSISGKRVEVKKNVITGVKLGTGPNGLHPERELIYENQLISEWVRPEKFDKGPVFLACNTDGISDDQQIRCVIFPLGVFKYENTLGINRSVRKYTAHPNDILVAARLKALTDADLEELKMIYPDFPPIPSETSSGLAVNGDSRTIGTTATGTGTAISDGSFVVTCAHVVEGAKKVSVKTADGAVIPVEIFAIDAAVDVAVLKIRDHKIPPVILCSSDCEQGQEVFTLGFPKPDVQGAESKLTDGKISSLSGLHDNRDEYQISVPVQPGNSGGGLFNSSGQLVGIIKSKLVKDRPDGFTPENVNYAVKSSHILRSLPRDNISLNVFTSPQSTNSAKLTAVVKEIKVSVVMVIAEW